MRFSQSNPDKEQQRKFLSTLLEKICALTPGNEITEPDMHFEVSVPIGAIRFSPEDKIMTGRMTLESWKKEKNSVGYTVRSDEGEPRILISNAMDYSCIDWALAGGTPSKDNLAGDYFLKLPLSNYIRGSEARISMKKSKKSVAYN